MTAEEFAALAPGDLIAWEQSGETLRGRVTQHLRSHVQAVEPERQWIVTHVPTLCLVKKAPPLQAEPPAAANPDPINHPPPGVMPRWLWIEHRCHTLLRAITKRIAMPLSPSTPAEDEMLAEWLDELHENIRESRYLRAERHAHAAQKDTEP